MKGFQKEKVTPLLEQLTWTSSERQLTYSRSMPKKKSTNVQDCKGESILSGRNFINRSYCCPLKKSYIEREISKKKKLLTNSGKCTMYCATATNSHVCKIYN